MNKKEKEILIFAGISHFFTHFYVLAFPALIMFFSRDFNLSISKILSIGFPMYLSYGLMAIPWGWLSDKYGYRLMMGLGVIFSGFGFVLASMTNSTLQLTLAFTLTGIGCSAYHPSGLALISKGVKQRGRAMGLNGMLGNLGIALAPLSVGLLSYFTKWKMCLFLFGIIGIIFGALSFFFPIDVHRDLEVQKGSKVEKNDTKKIFFIFCAALIFSGLMYRGFTLILPSFIEVSLPDFAQKVMGLFSGSMSQITGTKTLFAAIVASLIYLAGILGQYFGGKIADKKDLKIAYLLFFICLVPFLTMSGLIKGPFVLVFALGFSFFLFGYQPIENSFIALITPTRYRSLSYGIKFTLTFGLGALAVKILSIIKSKYNINTVVLVLLVPLVIEILLLSLMIFFTKGKIFKHKHD